MGEDADAAAIEALALWHDAACVEEGDAHHVTAAALRGMWRDLQAARAPLLTLAAPVPSTKGMDPKTRAQRLHADLERRIRIAKAAAFPEQTGREAG